MKFQKEFDDAQIKKMEREINRSAYGRDFNIIHGSTERNRVDTFGCAYTSSSDFAGLWNTNTETINRNGDGLDGFVIGEDNNMYALYTVYDEDRREIGASVVNLVTGEYTRI